MSIGTLMDITRYICLELATGDPIRECWAALLRKESGTILTRRYTFAPPWITWATFGVGIVRSQRRERLRLMAALK